MIKEKESLRPLYSERLIYSELSERDAPSFFELFSNPQVFEPMGMQRIELQHERFLRKIR